MGAISADSHVVEGSGVFAGLADRVGDQAPRVVSVDGKGDHIVVPARASRRVNVGDLIGEDRLMWGSDYPHTDSTWPCSAAVLDEMFDGYPADTRERITRRNVVQLYGL